MKQNGTCIKYDLAVNRYFPHDCEKKAHFICQRPRFMHNNPVVKVQMRKEVYQNGGKKNRLFLLLILLVVAVVVLVITCVVTKYRLIHIHL